MVHIENIPDQLKQRRRWICWKARPKGNGKMDKIPFDPRTGSSIDHFNPENQLSFDDCVAIVNQFKDTVSGIGYVFMEDDPFSGVDLDDCISPQTVLPAQQQIIRKLNSYAEISPSGQGVKIWVEGKLPGPNKKSQPEMYSNRIFFTVTGSWLNGNSGRVESRQKELELVYYQYYATEHPRFGELFSKCYLMRFLLEKSRSGINLPHWVRIALGSFSIAAGDLDTDEMPFITLMLSGCADFKFEVTRRQVQSLAKGENRAPWGCEALRKVVRDHFSDFDPSRCACALQVKGNRKPSPIRFVGPTFVEVNEEDDEEPDERLSPLPPFPLEVFPAPLQDLVQEVAAAFRVPVEIPACNLLSLSGSWIGRSRKIMVTKTWYQHANLWLVIVGKSGIGKSPSMDFLQAPMRSLQDRWTQEYQDALLEYSEAVELRKKAAREERAQYPRPKEPQRRQLFVDDVTTEALAGIFKANPRGLLWVRDEISGLLLDLDKYSGKEGGTKSRLMSAYDSGPWAMDRIGRSGYVPHACLSMFGGIQPKYLKTIFSELDADIGFLPRFLLIIVNRVKPATFMGATVSEASARTLEKLMHGLLDLRFDDQAQSFPVHLTPEARELYLDWHNKIAIHAFWNDPDFEPVVNKLQGQCLRIALNLYALEFIANEQRESFTVAPTTMTRALKLIEFFQAHQKRIWDHMLREKAISGLDPLAERVLHAILALAQKIEKGRLPTGVITDLLNAQGDDRFQLDPATVGRMARSLDLKVTRMPGGKRAYAISPEDLKRLKKLSDRCDGCDSNFLKEKVARTSQPPVGEDISCHTCHSCHKPEVKDHVAHDGCDGCDSNLLPEVVEESPQPNNVKFVTGAELEQYVREQGIKKIFVDTETTGLDPLSDQLSLIQVMAGGQVFFLKPEEDLRGLMADTSILKIFHNAKFDLQFLTCRVENLFDTYLAERLLTAGAVPLRELGLKYLAKKYVGIDLDKSLRTSFTPGAELTPEQTEYAAQDVRVLEPIFQAQKAKLQAQGLIDTAVLEFSIVPAVAQIERNGMLVDLTKLDALKTGLMTRIEQLETELKGLVSGISLSNQEALLNGTGINLRSPAQVQKVLRALGFEVESTGVETLNKIDHPFAQKLLEHRKASKLLSSFVGGLPKHVHPKTGRIHPDFHQLGTDTGRFSCSNPNLQQIPKEQDWRDLFVAPPGHKLITADYSQIELRILAEFAQDEVFLEAYRTGKDLHQETANQIGISRNQAKAINFGLCYGMSSSGLASRLGISREQAQSFISQYFRAYPKVKQCLDRLGMKAVSTGYSETPLGRRRHFPPADSEAAQKSLERKGRNTPIQSTCGDILKSALRNLMAHSEFKIINLVHDEIVFEVPEQTANQETVEVIRGAMVKAGTEFLKTVPVEVEIVVGDTWRK